MTIFEKIGHAVSIAPDGKAEDIAAAVMAGCRKADLMPLVVAEVRGTQRHLTRNRERSAFRAIIRGRKAQGSTPSAAMDTDKIPARREVPEGLRELFGTAFRLGDGSQIDWLTATVEQHQARIDQLSKLRAGLDATIDRHREAVRLINASGGCCLADIDKPDDLAA